MQLPSESAVTLRDDWGVNDLIAYLCRSQRSRIVVLLSARQRQTKPPVDADALKRRLGAKADVVVVPSALTFRLTDEFVRKRSAVFRQIGVNSVGTYSGHCRRSC